ncbi:MFS transporter [Yoonia sediminilitoris]|uniref:MFS transporter n=2 Tax=Yoonia sediminilitoris TaxID=1286148 RepID=A0A2T6KLQ0_9RHOB|nr:MFS transporter [Yoonia sediminilitoris]RCW97382.1 MFS transporter [Yoonia sediminilitoris]
MITSEIALLMAAFVFCGMLSQWPLGWLSDKIDRCLVIGTVSCGTVISGLAIWFHMAPPGLPTLMLAALHGALMIPIYALCISHANDGLPNAQMVETSGGLILGFSIGATIGPAAASLFTRGDREGWFQGRCDNRAFCDHHERWRSNRRQFQDRCR